MADLKITIDVRQVQKAEKTVDKSFDDIVKSAGKVDKSINNLEQTFDSSMKNMSNNSKKYAKNVQKDLKSSGSAFSGFLKTVKAAAVGYATVLATMEFNKFIADTFNAGIQLDALNRSFQAITGSAGEAGAQLIYISKTADTLGLKLTTLEQAYKGIYAASKNTALEGAQVQRVFTALTKAAAVLGMSADDTEGALRALSQMISKGNVQAKSLALYMVTCIANPVNSGKPLTFWMRAILSQAWNNISGRCNDYLFGEYTQVSGSAGHPIRVMI